MNMKNSNILPQGMPIDIGQISFRQQRKAKETHKSHGNSGGRKDLAKAWMYTPSATESRTILKRVIIDGIGAGSISDEQAKSLFLKYDLAEL